MILIDKSMFLRIEGCQGLQFSCRSTKLFGEKGGIRSTLSGVKRYPVYIQDLFVVGTSRTIRYPTFGRLVFYGLVHMSHDGLCERLTESMLTREDANGACLSCYRIQHLREDEKDCR